jgi:single-stranded-DNA-specific exonuclease
MIARWRLREFDAARVEALSRGAGVPPLVALLLLNRGIGDPDLAREFIEAKRTSLHDPELLPGAAEAAQRIARAVAEDRPIVIYGDYDVDGVCGTSLLWACLKLAGARNVHYYIPDRIEEGYGVNGEALGLIAAKYGRALVVTVDCGITALAEARLARSLGLELIVTDHHELAAELPDADVLVHPRLPGSRYPFGALCGCGVAFKVAWQVCKGFGDGKKASPHLRNFLVEALNLVALATVADVVPLEGENRIFVRHGLRGLSGQPSIGSRALLEVSGMLGKDLTTGSIGFGLAPRINAAGRMSKAIAAVEMLTTADPELALDRARELDECNKKRQEVEAATVAEARRMLDESGGLHGRGAIVLGKAGWHPGVIGIVAGRLAETYHRPTIIVALDGHQGQGSARSIPGFNLIEALRACSEDLTRFGGHAAAAGLKVSSATFDAFAERFDRHCRDVLTHEQLQKTLTIDAEVPLGTLNLRTVEQVSQLEPYGLGNPRPVLMADAVRVVGEPKGVGDRGQHLRMRVAQGANSFSVIGWNLAERGRALKAGAVCSIAFEPDINEWRDRREVQLVLRDFQVAGEPARR